MTIDKRPKGLGPAGRRTWDAVQAAVDDEHGWMLDQRDYIVLREACQQADLIASLEAAVDTQGVTVSGAAGQERLNPAVTALTNARALLQRLLFAIEIAPPVEKTGHLNSRQRGQLRSAAMREAYGDG
jgi:hypothetical protein